MRVAISILLLAGVAGCQTGPVQPASQPVAKLTGNEVAASVAGLPITLEELMQPLVKHYPNACLEVLVHTMQLKLIKHQAELQKVTVAEDDLKQEQTRSLLMFFPTISESEKIDPQQAQGALMQQARVGAAGFSLWIEGNAYVRKMVEPSVMETVTEENLRKAFGIMYGEKARVRHIQLANMQEVRNAQARLAAGEKFEDVARAMSRDTRNLDDGGALPPYTRQTAPSVAFEQATFSLKPGQVSDPVQSGDFYHLIKLEEIIPPKMVKFETPEIYAAVRDAYVRSAMRSAIISYRDRVARAAHDQIVIALPSLRERFEAERDKATAKERSKSEWNKQWDEAAARAASQLSTRPTTTTAPTTSSAIRETPNLVERPPATRPGQK